MKKDQIFCRYNITNTISISCYLENQFSIVRKQTNKYRMLTGPKPPPPDAKARNPETLYFSAKSGCFAINDGKRFSSYVVGVY
mgnify:FL=1